MSLDVRKELCYCLIKTCNSDNSKTIFLGHSGIHKNRKQILPACQFLRWTKTPLTQHFIPIYRDCYLPHSIRVFLCVFNGQPLFGTADKGTSVMTPHLIVWRRPGDTFMGSPLSSLSTGVPPPPLLNTCIICLRGGIKDSLEEEKATGFIS